MTASLKQPLPRDKSIEELWYRGNLRFHLNNAQKTIDNKFKSITKQVFVGNCARQWGKSFWACTKAVEQAIKKPNSQIRYGAAFQTDLVDFIIPNFDKVMEGCPAPIAGKYKGSKSRYVFPNGSIIKLVGLDKHPNGLRGNALDLVIIDECGFVSKLDYLYKSVIVPTSVRRPDAKFILISTPSETPAHEFTDYCLKAEMEGSYACFDIYTNPDISEEDIERLAYECGGKHTTTWQREYLCKFVTDSDSAIIPEWKDEFVKDIPRDEFYQYYHRYSCMDMGRVDHTALAFGYYDFKKAALIIEDELTMHGPEWTTETLKRDLLYKEKSLWGDNPKAEKNKKGELKPFEPYRRIADNNNPHLILDLSSIHDVYFIETTKESLEAMVNELRMFVKEGRLLVNPRCKMLIGCLKYGVWDQKRKEFARSKVYGHFDHLAGLIYLIRNLDRNTNPIPALHGMDRHKTFTHHIDNMPPKNLEALKTVLNLKGRHGRK